MNLIALTAIIGVLLIAFLLYVLSRKPEKSSLLTALGVALVFFIGMFFTVLIPSFNQNWSTNTAMANDAGRYHVVYDASQIDPATGDYRLVTDKGQITPQTPLVGYSKLQARGRLVYQREGCMYCHSQQIRPLKGEMLRYSIGSSMAPPADEREYIWDQPHFLGTRRIGPDLSRVGGKYSDDWHYSHFFYPRQLVPESVMPAFTWMFTKDPDGNPVPNDDMRGLVAYVQTLGYGRQVYEQPYKADPKTHELLRDASGDLIKDGPGRWQPWLKPQDQQSSQNNAEGEVKRADPNAGGGLGGVVRGQDAVSPTNKIAPKPRVRVNPTPPPTTP